MCSHPGRGVAITNILLVEDDHVLRELGLDLLTEAGYRVLTAAHGKEAIEVYQSNAQEIALVVLDLAMPIMSGWECLPELQKIDPSLRVLIWSGASPAEMPEIGGQSGVFGHVPKSSGAEALVQSIRRALGPNGT